MNADGTPMNADAWRRSLDAISRKVIGAAQRVSSDLGYGFLEKVYENSLALELQWMGLKFQQQGTVPVLYRGVLVGNYLPDLLVEEEVLVEIKATPCLDREHRQQCLNYLRATRLHVCLLLNFGRPRQEVRRFVWQF